MSGGKAGSGKKDEAGLIEDIGREVKRTAALEARAHLTPAVFKSYGAPPPPVDPAKVPRELVEECFPLEHYGDGKLLAYMFKNRYLRDNQATGGDDKKQSLYIYKYNGHNWDLDIAKCWQNDFMWALGEVYRLMAETLYAEILEEYHLESLAQVRRLHKELKTDAEPKNVALLKKGDDYMTRRKRVMTRKWLHDAADVAFSGEESLSFKGKWNDHPTWLPCLNGTVDLSTGELMEPKPEHYFNMCLEYEYKGPDEACPEWLDMVGRVFGYDQELIEFMELIIGAACTGFQPKYLVIGFGPKANNGKSLFFGTLLKILNPFSCTMAVDVLLKQGPRSSSSGRPELLRLDGKRMVVTKEADGSAVFDCGQVKDLTSGGDEISHRNLHNPAFQSFAQSHSLFIHTNSIPRLYGGDRGLAARLLVVPFFSSFIQPHEGEEDIERNIYHARDRWTMEAVFRRESSGILGWLVKCAMRWLGSNRQFPPPPPEIARLSQEVMMEFDIVKQFLDERCQEDPEFSVMAKDLYANFKDWCQNERGLSGKEIISMQLFGRDMKNHAHSKRTSDGMEYLGLRIKPGIVEY